MEKNMILKTKIMPPRLKTSIFLRPKLHSIFQKISDYNLCLVQAGPGYGKTTFVLDFCQQSQHPYYWYTIDIEDRDPYTFLLHLIYLFRRETSWVGDDAIELLPRVKQNPLGWVRPLELFVNDLVDCLEKDSLLILDDLHAVGHDAHIHGLIERLIEIKPDKLHIIISSREIPQFRRLIDWRAKGKLLEVQQENLALDKKEVYDFFQHQYNCTLSESETQAAYQGTRGWIMALEMVWQSHKEGQKIAEIFQKPWSSLPVLFDFLAQEVLECQKQKVQDFLLQTSILQVLEVDTCNHLNSCQNSHHVLKNIYENGLLTIKLDGQRMHYHPLFKKFLERRLQDSPERWYQLNLKMAHYFQDRDNLEEAIYHLLQAGQESNAASLMVQNIPKLKKRVSFPVMGEWLQKISFGVLKEFPRLLIFKGDLERFASRYMEALDQYSRALDIFKTRNDRQGMVQAYQKMATIYLDTVQPAKAEEYLREGLAIQEEEALTGETSLLNLLAENRANKGDAEGARRLIDASDRLGKEAESKVHKIHLQTRLLLRTGRLKKGIETLEELIGNEVGLEEREPKTHRENPMILSLLYSFCGEAKKGEDAACQGLTIAQALNSPFTEAVGYMRLGHAWQIHNNARIDKVIDIYEKALNLMDRIGVERGRAEALWGMSLAWAYHGNSTEALNGGLECCRISFNSGDEWMANQGRLALGINYYLGGQWKSAFETFNKTLNFFRSVNDLFGRALSHLWLAVLLYQQEEDSWQEEFLHFLKIAWEQDYSFLFRKRTFLGPRDYRVIAPLIIKILDHIEDISLKEWLKLNSNLQRFDYHPGFILHINALGPLRVFRGSHEITDGHWKREKAKELFKLFITHPGELLPREKIFSLIWPEENEETASRDFKVALNALNSVLEPTRKARTSPYFIKRQGQAYGLDRDSSYILDVEIFQEKIEKALKENNQELLEEALELYQGDYLSFSLYHDWIREPREHLRRTFFLGCEKLARIFLEKGEPEKALALSEKMLAHDNCWEVAYQLAMQAYLDMDNRYLAQQMYLKCVKTLEEELAIEPLPATREYLKKVFGPGGLERFEKELKNKRGGYWHEHH